MSLLMVDNLNVSFQTPTGIFHAVKDVNFHIQSKEVFGILGESGAGKSQIFFL